MGPRVKIWSPGGVVLHILPLFGERPPPNALAKIGQFNYLIMVKGGYLYIIGDFCYAYTSHLLFKPNS